MAHATIESLRRDLHFNKSRGRHAGVVGSDLVRDVLEEVTGVLGLHRRQLEVVPVQLSPALRGPAPAGEAFPLRVSLGGTVVCADKCVRSTQAYQHVLTVWIQLLARDSQGAMAVCEGGVCVHPQGQPPPPSLTQARNAPKVISSPACRASKITSTQCKEERHQVGGTLERGSTPPLRGERSHTTRAPTRDRSTAHGPSHGP